MKRRIHEKVGSYSIFLLISISLFSAYVVYGESLPQVVVAPESSPAPPPVVTPMTLEQIREMIRQNGFTYTVGETWVSALSPQEMASLLGYVPSRFDLSHLAASSDVAAVPSALPPAYDYRTSGKVTPPKNQGACGSCWAFAGIGELESKILMEGGLEYDLSEENVLSCNYYGQGCSGGNDWTVANHLTQFGAALETCAPYDGVDGTACKSCETIRKLNGWAIIGTNLDSENATQINIVKQALLDYGPLFVTMNAAAPGFSTYTGGVFEYWGIAAVNHAVLLIGWDDSLVHSHGSGAWIVKNSWGTSWGEGGYFKIAYGSANICENVSAYSTSRGLYYREKMYFYDERGMQGAFYAVQYDTWGAVRFVPTASGKLERVEFWSTDDNLNYTIRVYDTMAGSRPYTFSGLLASQTGHVSRSGYVSIELATKPVITSGNDFIIVMRFNTPDYPFPVPYDGGTPISGQSYFSTDGSTWYRLTDEGDNIDVGIRGVMRGSLSSFAGYPGYFSTNSFFVVGNDAYCTDVLGTGKIAYGLAAGGVTENPEGRTHTILTTTEHTTGNLIGVGGPAINPIAVEFDTVFGVSYAYNPGVSFYIFCEEKSIYLNLTQYPTQDICVVYIGDENSRNVMLAWGYGWQGTYAGSMFMGTPANWQAYQGAHLLLLRWTDSSGDGLVQMSEVVVESYS